MAAGDADMKDRISASYLTARNAYFHLVVKWFSKDLTDSEVCDNHFNFFKLNIMIK
jgi:hypothetical protein